MNAKARRFLLTKLIPFIQREHGNGFVMEDWITQVDDESYLTFDNVSHRKAPSCGTVACIGGSVEILLKLKSGDNNRPIADALGLTLDEADGLFYVYQNESDYCWPARYRSRFAAATTPRGKASVAVALLKEIAEKGGSILKGQESEESEEE